MKKLFLSPHNDDETLFGAYAIQRHRPDVLVVFDSYLQVIRGYYSCDMQTRCEETIDAMGILLGGCAVDFLGLSDAAFSPAAAIAEALQRKLNPKSISDVWAPAFEEGGHDQHNAVAVAASMVFPDAKIHRYLTYTRHAGKSRNGVEVKPDSGVMVRRKLQALACYKTQIEIDALGCWQHFANDLKEYVLTEEV